MSGHDAIPNDQELSRVRLNERFDTSLLRHAVGCSSQYTLEFRQLAAEILRLRHELDEARRNPAAPDDVMDIYVPGNWTCPKCQFVLSSSTIFMGTGEIGCTRDQVMAMSGEFCPNDGEPMRRVTWRERAAANQQWGEALMEQIIAATGAEDLPGALAAIKELSRTSEQTNARAGQDEIAEKANENADRPPCE